MYKHDMANHPETKYKYHKTNYKPTTPTSPTSSPTNTVLYCIVNPIKT